MIITLHLIVENLALLGLTVGDKLVLNDFQNFRAYFLKLRLNLALVIQDVRQLALLTLLLNARCDAPASASRPNDIFVSNRKKVPLLHGQFLGLLGYHLHMLNHFIKPRVNASGIGNR